MRELCLGCMQNMTDEVPQEKEYRLYSIRNLYAFDLFCQHRFEDSLNIFTQLGTGLYLLLVCFRLIQTNPLGMQASIFGACPKPG